MTEEQPTETDFATAAERDVLGIILADLQEGLVARASEHLVSDDFVDRGRRGLWEAMLRVHAQGQRTGKAKMFAALGAMSRDDRTLSWEAFAALCGGEYNPALLMPAIRVLKARSAQRRGAEILARVTAFRPGFDDAAVLAELLADVARAHAGATPAAIARGREIAKASMETAGQVGAIRTGIWALDARFGGFAAGEMTVIAARPSVGKSLLALQVALHAARRARAAFVVSLEMGIREIGQRAVAHVSGVELQAIRRDSLGPGEPDQLASARVDLAGSSIRLAASYTSDLRRIEALVRQEHASEPIELLVIDYLGLLRVPGARDRRLEVVEATRALKTLAAEQGIALLLVAQLSRLADEYSEPTLEGLAESSSIEQDADNVLLLWRTDAEEPRRISCKIAKQRHGEQSVVALWADGARMTISAQDEQVL